MVLRAVLVTPLTGPLARYGEAGATALRLWAEWHGAPIDLSIVDAYPDPVAAAREAERRRPDLLFGPYGSGQTTAVAATTDRLLFNHGGARAIARPNLVTVLAPADTYLHGALRAVRRVDDSIRRVAVLHGDTGFGRSVASGALDEARRLGITATSATVTSEPEPADMLLVVANFGEELAAARRLLPGHWRAAAFVGAGVDEVLAELRERREGLLGPAQWVESAAPPPTEGPTATEFGQAYRRATGTPPPYPAAQAFAAGVIATRCLRDAGTTDDESLLAAARALTCVTLFGAFTIDANGRQTGHEVLTTQWQTGVRQVVWPPDQAQRNIAHPLSASGARSTGETDRAR